MQVSEFFHWLDAWLHANGQQSAEPDGDGVVTLMAPAGEATYVRLRDGDRAELFASPGHVAPQRLRQLFELPSGEDFVSADVAEPVMEWSEGAVDWQLCVRERDGLMVLTYMLPAPHSTDAWQDAILAFQALQAEWSGRLLSVASLGEEQHRSPAS